MGRGSVSSVLVVLLNADWHIVAFAMVLTACLRWSLLSTISATRKSTDEDQSLTI